MDAPPTTSLKDDLAALRDRVAELERTLREATLERQDVERKGVTAERLAETLRQQASDCIIVLDEQGFILDGNPAALTALGYPREQLVGRPVRDFLLADPAPEVQLLLRSDLNSEAIPEQHWPVRSRTGKELAWDVRCFPVAGPETRLRFFCIGRDRTERKQFEEQLRQAQKREAVALLAGDIAHEFSNLLTGVIGYADMLQLSIRPGDPHHEAVSVIQGAAEQGVQLTRQLLLFMRRERSEFAPLDLAGVLGDVVKLVRHVMPKHVRVASRVQEPLWMKGDRAQLRQVFLNLILNAKDAMPDGGDLILHASMSPRPGGPELLVKVTDTGSGIPQDQIGQIFEPFFTTKPPGQGSGLGLPISRGIIEQHGGRIEVHSQAGEGATFAVYLPAAVAGQGEKSEDVKRPCVLLIEAEELVRKVASRMLEGLGYRVLAAEDTRQAAAIYRAGEQKCPAVIVDVDLGPERVRDCLYEMQAIHSDVRLILSGASGRDSTVQALLEEGFAAFLPKPYQLSTLASTVAGVLAKTRSG